jgi:hypothetical protein
MLYFKLFSRKLGRLAPVLATLPVGARNQGLGLAVLRFL